MKYTNKTRNSFGPSRRRGSVAIIVAGGMVVFLGFCALAVDYGLLVIDKNRVQRAADAAALAGAQELKKSNPTNDALDTQRARDFAVTVAAQNFTTVAPSGVTFSDNNTKITVSATSTRPLYFARVIGLVTGQVDAMAAAKISPVTSYPAPKVVPIGITDTTLNAYTQPVLKTDIVPLRLTRLVDAPYVINDFILFDLRPNNAKSPSAMSNQLAGTADFNVKIGQMESSLNASGGTVENFFKPPLAGRFQRASQAPWLDFWSGTLDTSVGIRYLDILEGRFRADSPRVMNLVVNHEAPAGGGTTDHEIIAFAPVYVESFNQTTNLLTGVETLTLNVRFLPPIFGAGNIISDPNSTNPGNVRTVSLVQ